MYRFIAFGHSHIVAFAKGAYEYQASDLTGEAPRIEGRFVFLYDPFYNPVLQGPLEAPQLNPKLSARSRSFPGISSFSFAAAMNIMFSESSGTSGRSISC